MKTDKNLVKNCYSAPKMSVIVARVEHVIAQSTVPEVDAGVVYDNESYGFRY